MGMLRMIIMMMKKMIIRMTMMIIRMMMIMMKLLLLCLYQRVCGVGCQYERHALCELNPTLKSSPEGHILMDSTVHVCVCVHGDTRGQWFKRLPVPKFWNPVNNGSPLSL
jgi:hypothetical protein